MNSSQFFTRLLLVFVCSLLSIVAVGCNSDDSGSENKDTSTTKNIPKQNFHKPKNIADAAKRLGDLFSAIDSEEALPEPISYTVLEVIHGTGASAHSHYHLHTEDSEKPLFPGEENVESDEKLHEIKIGAIEEFSDIIRWLPSIAADSDMSKDHWNKANKVSSDIQNILDGADSEKSAEAKRKYIRDNAKSFSGPMEILNSLVSPK